MDSKNSNICLYSYNSRGSSEEKLNYIQEIINLCGNNLPVCLVQEHFLLRSNIYKLSKFFKSSAVLAKPAFKNFENQNTGRPMGGLAVIIPKHLRKCTKVINCDSWRLQPVLFNCGGKQILIINSYFPTDPKTIAGENQELVSTLAELVNILETTTFDTLYLAGDINTEFMRRTSHVQAVRDFMLRCNLVSLWDYYEADFTHTFERESGEIYHNTIDHILTLKRSMGTIVTAGVLHNVANMSDHEPVYAVIKVDHVPKKEASEEQVRPPKPVWKNASDDQKLEFNDVLFRKLLSMDVPASVSMCTDVKCNDENHKKEIDCFVTKLLENISESGHETIPLVDPNRNTKGRKKTPGWKEIVEPFQDKAHFWHSVWCSAGRPVNTELHRIMKHTRNTFHYQVRKCRRVQDFIRNRKLVENCLENDTDLFSEIRKLRSNDNQEDITIDGAEGKDIPNKFAEIYDELFNREDDEENIEHLSNGIHRDINEESMREVLNINSEVIKEAMEKLKPNKSDPIYDFTSDFLKNAPDILYEQLALVLKSFLIHGHVTESLLLATLVPIVKDKLDDLCSSKIIDQLPLVLLSSSCLIGSS